MDPDSDRQTRVLVAGWPHHIQIQAVLTLKRIVSCMPIRIKAQLTCWYPT
jgi:hypothetical protein